MRRAFYLWLVPAAFVLPLWILLGWGIFQAGGWAFLWVLFIAVPSVFLGQLLLTLLTRSRPSVRAERAEILPQFLSGHIPRAEKAPGKGQTQPQSTDFPLHTIFPPMTTAKIDDTEYSIFCVQFQDAAA